MDKYKMLSATIGNAVVAAWDVVSFLDTISLWSLFGAFTQLAW